MISDFKSLVKTKNFSYLWSSQILSQFTIQIMNFLLLIRLFEETGSTIATSFLWVAYALPAIIIGPFAAASVDMIDRRTTLIVANLLQAATIFLYALTHQTSLFLLYGVAMMYSLLNQFYVPAELAALPTLVSKKKLPFANGLFFMTQQVAIVGGFSLAGLMKKFLGFSTTLYFSAGLLFIAFLSVLKLPKMETEEKVPAHFEKAVVKFFQGIFEGYRYIKDNNFILIPLSLMLMVYTSAAVITVNIPIIVQEIFKVNLDLAGLLIAVPGGIGTLIGALTIPRVLKRGLRKIRIIETSFVIIAVSLLIYTFFVPALSGFKSIYLGVFTTILTGFAFVGILIPTQTFLQEKTPKALRGRVFGNYWFLASVVTLFPVIFSATITELFGIRFLFLLISGISLISLYLIKKHANEFIKAGFSFKRNNQ
ncbi:MAG: MFS transporter [Patescibacteria group bacterium]